MKKKIIGIILITVAAVTGTWNFCQTQSKVELPDLVLANVEALARYEGDPVGCLGIGCRFDAYTNCEAYSGGSLIKVCFYYRAGI